MPTNVDDNQRRAKSWRKHFGKVQVYITMLRSRESLQNLTYQKLFLKIILKKNLTNKKSTQIKEIELDKAQRIPLTEYIALVRDKLLKFNLAHKQLK